MSPPPRISRNFHVKEFHSKDGARVPLRSYRALGWLAARYLEPLRAEFGVVNIYSGYRSESYNRAVGGAPLSRHRYDLAPLQVAADVSCHRGTPHDWYELLDQLGAGGLGLYPGFVHVDRRPGRARW